MGKMNNLREICVKLNTSALDVREIKRAGKNYKDTLSTVLIENQEQGQRFPYRRTLQVEHGNGIFFND